MEANRKNKSNKGSLLLIVLLPLSVIAIAAMLLCKTPYFYSGEFEKLEVLEKMELQVAPSEMGRFFSRYMNGNVENFQMKANYQGENREVFHEKEMTHMEDVKKVVNGVMVFGMICTLGSLALYIFVYKKHKLLLRKRYKGSLAFFAAILIFFAVIGSLDFNKGFEAFHEIFFTNDLWMLDPNKDLLLMMMPLPFFIDGLICLLILAGIFLAIIGIITWQLTKERNR